MITSLTIAFFVLYCLLVLTFYILARRDRIRRWNAYDKAYKAAEDEINAVIDKKLTARDFSSINAEVDKIIERHLSDVR